MIIGALSAAFIALVAADFSKYKANSPISLDSVIDGLSLDTKEAYGASPYAYYPVGDSHQHLIDAGYPKYPISQGNPTLRDPYGALLCREPDAKQSALINKDDIRNWQSLAGLVPGTAFFDGRVNMKLHESKWEKDDWCMQTTYLPTLFTPLYEEFSGKTQGAKPKLNGGFLLF